MLRSLAWFKILKSLSFKRSSLGQVAKISQNIFKVHKKIEKYNNFFTQKYIFFYLPFKIYMDTYIHKRSSQPFSQDYSLASHNTHVVCVNFIYEWRDLQFNVDSEWQIFKKLSWHVYYSQSFCQKSAERKSPKKYFFFIFRFDVWPEIPNRALRLISQHTTY